MSYLLLINTNTLRPRIAPIAFDYLCSVLEQQKVRFKIFDLSFERKGWSKKLAELIRKDPPFLIGITLRNLDDCYFLSGKFLAGKVRWLVQFIKKNFNIPIVVGGVGYSLAPRALLEYLGADYGIWGDGEEALLALAKVLQKGQEPRQADIQGLVGKGFALCSRAMADLRNFSFQRSFVQNSLYFKLGGQIGIETKRGCDGRCIYCADLVSKGRKFRLREPESVADELEELVRKGIWAFHLCDSEFNRPYSHCMSVLEEICKRGLNRKIKLYGYFSPARFDNDLAQLYARAGGAGICFGADSGAEEVLESLRRDHTPDDLARAVSLCKKHKIRVMLDLLLGAPKESKKTLRKTISLMKKIKPDRVGLSWGVRVFAYTDLEKKLRKQEQIPDGIIGAWQNNPELIYPVFYLEPSLQKDGLAYLEGLIGSDPCFFLPSAQKKSQDYNYSQNLFLERLIKKGARGAYWAILLEESEKRQERQRSRK